MNTVEEILEHRRFLAKLPNFELLCLICFIVTWVVGLLKGDIDRPMIWEILGSGFLLIAFYALWIEYQQRKIIRAVARLNVEASIIRRWHSICKAQSLDPNKPYTQINKFPKALLQILEYEAERKVCEDRERRAILGNLVMNVMIGALCTVAYRIQVMHDTP